MYVLISSSSCLGIVYSFILSRNFDQSLNTVFFGEVEGMNLWKLHVKISGSYPTASKGAGDASKKLLKILIWCLVECNFT